MVWPILLVKNIYLLMYIFFFFYLYREKKYTIIQWLKIILYGFCVCMFNHTTYSEIYTYNRISFVCIIWFSSSSILMSIFFLSLFFVLPIHLINSTFWFTLVSISFFFCIESVWVVIYRNDGIPWELMNSTNTVS